MTAAISNSVPNPLGQIFLDLGNHDQCDSCGEGGDLLCCDNCPRSFHFECVNPPLDGRDVEMMKEDWFCPLCFSTKKQKNGNSKRETEFVMEPMFTRLKESNPYVFSLPPEIKQGLDDFMRNESNHKEKIDLDSAKRKTKTNTMKMTRQEDVCSVCNLSGETICCRACNQSYHSYCLDPPILFENSSVPWYCSNHSFREHVVPDQTFKLSFEDPNFNDLQNNDLLNAECSKLLLEFCQSIERPPKRKAAFERNSTAKKPKKVSETTIKETSKETKEKEKETKETKETLKETPKESPKELPKQRPRKSEKIATITNTAGKILYTMKKSSILLGRSKAENTNVDFSMSDVDGLKTNAVSRNHATIFTLPSEDNKRKVFMLQSHGRNGTKVDGVLVLPNQSAVLRDKSILEINKFAMSFNVLNK